MGSQGDAEHLAIADDRIVAGRAADGDVQAFRVLVSRHSPLMRGYARRILGTNDEVDDVVQDAFIVAWRQLPELEDPSAVKSWLMRIVGRKAVDRVRARHPHVDIDDHDRPAPDAAAPARRAEARSQVEELSAALAELPLMQRQCWVLREVGEYSYDEIAAELGVPATTVRGLLARARKYLIVRMGAWR
ncbi:MAG TPA: RNA polymerase sigma factor [Lacisediminihabitans sp.]|uniref:RNA polymerase sigma factor n=1 Tax=Lacisediminihabitans sp. TaxID=2787631 RepID=UPI002EDB5A1D